jgi:hypothetical protein
MTLIQSAKLNGHDLYAYLKNVLTRLPTQKNSAIDELLPHNWRPAITPGQDPGLAEVGIPPSSIRNSLVSQSPTVEDASLDAMP